MNSTSEPERDDRGGDQPDIDLAGAEPADGGHLLLHHGTLRPPRLLRHLLRTAIEREFKIRFREKIISFNPTFL